MVEFCFLDCIYALKLFPVVCYNEKDGRAKDDEKVEIPTKITKKVHAHWWN